MSLNHTTGHTWNSLGHVGGILGNWKLGSAVVCKGAIPSLLQRGLALHLLLRQGVIRDGLDQGCVRGKATGPGLREKMEERGVTERGKRPLKARLHGL